MIIVVRKRNIALVAAIFLLAVLVYSINFGTGESKPVTAGKDVQRTIILDPGHGGEDPGAVSNYSGLKEKDVNLNVASKLKELLEKEEFRIIMTRSDDRLEYESDTSSVTQKRMEDLTRRKKIMDGSGADIVVSIHLNKFQQSQYYGAQTFYPPNSPESQRLAVSIQQSLKESLDLENTRQALEKKEPLIILKDNKTTTVIVECGFLSNENEEKKLASAEYQEKIAVAIKDGILNYFNKQ